MKFRFSICPAAHDISRRRRSHLLYRPGCNWWRQICQSVLLNSLSCVWYNNYNYPYLCISCWVKPCPHCRRKVRLSQKSAIVAENGEKTAKFGDCRTFLRQYSRTFCDSVDRLQAVINNNNIVTELPLPRFLVHGVVWPHQWPGDVYMKDRRIYSDLRY